MAVSTITLFFLRSFFFVGVLCVPAVGGIMPMLPPTVVALLTSEQASSRGSSIYHLFESHEELERECS